MLKFSISMVIETIIQYNHNKKGGTDNVIGSC